MPGRRDPFRDIEELFDRLSEDFGTLPRELEGSDGPRVDVAETDEDVVVTLDLPGYERDDVDVTVTDDTLHVEAERRVEAESEERHYYRRERRRERVDRSVQLPAPVDESSASATLSNGVLTVTLPKVGADSAGHSIDIE